MQQSEFYPEVHFNRDLFSENHLNDPSEPDMNISAQKTQIRQGLSQFKAASIISPHDTVQILNFLPEVPFYLDPLSVNHVFDQSEPNMNTEAQ